MFENIPRFLIRLQIVTYMFALEMFVYFEDDVNEASFHSKKLFLCLIWIFDLMAYFLSRKIYALATLLSE